MGLGLSVDGKSCGQWSYSGFNYFRKRLAKEAGIILENMKGFSAVDKTILEKEGFSAYRKALEEEDLSQKISWDTIDDPIKILLNHSDCDGQIGPEVCIALADRLEELIKDWPKTTEFDTNQFWQEKGYPAHMVIDEHDYCQATALIRGLRTAAEIGKPIEFH